MKTKTANSAAPAAEWRRYRERGSQRLLRWMAHLSLWMGRPLSRVVLYVAAAYFFVFAPTLARHSRSYLRRALGREPTARDRYRQFLYFASTIHDRVYLINQRLELYRVTIEGEAFMRRVLEAGHGAFLLGAHMGSAEVAGTLARREGPLRIAMAMYPDNARAINSIFAALSSENRPEIIPLGHLDAMLRLRQRLDEGAFVSLMGDRTLGDEPVQSLSFLGSPAAFPVGPVRVAAILHRPVIVMLGLYRGANRYHVVFEQLADFSSTAASEREAAIHAAVQRYAALLERFCRSDPYNWFNFFDFWQDQRRDESRAPS